MSRNSVAGQSTILVKVHYHSLDVNKSYSISPKHPYNFTGNPPPHRNQAVTPTFSSRGLCEESHTNGFHRRDAEVAEGTFGVRDGIHHEVVNDAENLAKPPERTT